MSKVTKYKEMGNLINRHRVSAGILQQADLASELGVKQQTVSKWERGLARPKLELIERLAQLIHADAAEIQREAGYYPSEDASPTIRTVTSFEQNFPIDALTAEGFERFCTYLLRELYPDHQVERMGKTGHKQDGVDIYIRSGERLITVAQCKRVEKFGPTQVSEVIMDLSTFDAQTKMIMLSRVASPATRAAVEANKDCVLLDKENISDKIRSLSIEQQKRLIDVFFRGQRFALIGEPDRGPWQSKREFFEPFDQNRVAFNHKWKLVGRDNEVKQLLDYLCSDHRVVFLTGPGGTGKSRLLKEIADKLEIEKPGLRIYFLNPAAEADAESLESLGDQKKIVVIDNAHEQDIRSAVRFAAIDSNNTKLLLSLRPHGLQLLRSETATGGISPNELAQVVMPPLTLHDATKLSAQVLEEFKCSSAYAELVARSSQDCALAVVMASYVVANEQLGVELAKNADFYRDTLRGRFTSILTGDIGSKNDSKIVRSILNGLSLLQPFNANDDEVSRIINLVEKVPISETNRIIKMLVTAGVLVKRNDFYRISPEMISDFLIEEMCVGIDGRSSGFAEQYFASLTRDYLVENLLYNIGRLDWRLNRGDSSSSVLLDNLWYQLSHKYAEPPVKAVETIAFFQPHRALEFAEQLIRQGRCLLELPPILKNIAYNEAYTERACQALWELGKNDQRELNQYPNHAIRILSDLSAIEYSADQRLVKSIAINKIVTEFAIRLANSPDEHMFYRSPFSILAGLMRTEGRMFIYDGKHVGLNQFAVIPTEEIVTLRRMAIENAIALLNSGNVRIGVNAAEFLNSSFKRATIITDYNKLWQRESENTLKLLDAEVRRSVPPDLVSLELFYSLDSQRRRGNLETQEIADRIISLLPSSLQFRCLKAFTAGFETYLQKSEDGRFRPAPWIDELVQQLILDFPEGTDLIRFLNEQLSKFLEIKNIDVGRASNLMGSLILKHPTLSEAVVERAKDVDDYFTRQFSGPALAKLLDTAIEVGNRFTREFVESDIERLQIIASTAFNMAKTKLQLTASDLELLKYLLNQSRKNVVGQILSTMRVLSVHGNSDALTLASHLRISEHPYFAGTYFEIVSDLSATVTEEHANHMFQELSKIRCRSDYGTQCFLSKMSMQFPRLTADFLMRMAHQSSQAESLDPDEYEIDFDNSVPLQFRQSGAGTLLILEFIEWMRKTTDSTFRYNAARLFNRMFSPMDSEVTEILSQASKTGTHENVQLIAQILSHASSDFIFREVSFVEQFLDKANSVGTDCLQIAMQALQQPIMSGVRHGLFGQPFEEDIEVSGHCERILQKLPRFSQAYQFYAQIQKSTQTEIRARGTLFEPLSHRDEGA